MRNVVKNHVRSVGFGLGSIRGARQYTDGDETSLLPAQMSVSHRSPMAAVVSGQAPICSMASWYMIGSGLPMAIGSGQKQPRRNNHCTSARYQPFFRWIGWIEIRGDKTCSTADQQGGPLEFFIGDVAVHAGDHQWDIVIGQDKTFVGHSLLEGRHPKDMDACPAWIFARQESRRGFA